MRKNEFNLIQAALDQQKKFRIASCRLDALPMNQALQIADRVRVGDHVSADAREALQMIIDSNTAWHRGESFARKMRDFIESKTCTRARRTYCPNPKPIEAKAVKNANAS